MIDQKKSDASRSKIKDLLGAQSDDNAVKLFAEHHLAELEQEDLSSLFGTPSPSSAQLIDALVLVNTWSQNDDEVIDTYDWSLPGAVTNYLLSVVFDGDAIETVEMES